MRSGETMGKVSLVGLEFRGNHGVYPEERRLGSRFVVDVDLEFDFSELHDDVKRTVNYASVYEWIAHEITQTSHQLIETLAQTLADQLMKGYPQLEGVRVRVHKPQAPLTGVFQDVWAEVTSKRDLP